jgi:hypothetical protein
LGYKNPNCSPGFSQRSKKSWQHRLYSRKVSLETFFATISFQQLWKELHGNRAFIKLTYRTHARTHARARTHAHTHTHTHSACSGLLMSVTKLVQVWYSSRSRWLGPQSF